MVIRCNFVSKISKLIFLKYEEKGDSKTGIIKIKFNYNLADDTLNYAGIDYSDNGIQLFMEYHPLILSKIEAFINKTTQII
jgi:TPP-dependent indolepyruvate ferredoxin oxidoreductase alpha subunit